MAAAAATRALTRRGPGSLAFALASDADEPDIRRLLRENAFPGAVSLSFEREPDAALAASIEGPVQQTLVARERATGRIVGIAARTIRDAFLNGRPARVGYLGQLRVDRHCRCLRALLDEGFAFCRGLHHGGDVQIYLTSLVADNEAARRLVIERRSPTAPRFSSIERLTSLALSLRRRPPSGVDPPEIRVVPGTPDSLSEIAACLQRNLRRCQFAPRWTAEDLRSPVVTRGLAPEDFMLATRGGRVVGCTALWDQRAYKQVVVRGYVPALRRVRPLVNLAAPLIGLPPLPAVGRPIELAYLSHVAVDQDRADVLTALVAGQCRRARARGLDYLVTAFAERHPFRHALAERFVHRAYPSVLYVASWPDGDAIARSLDNRPCQPEVAVL